MMLTANEIRKTLQELIISNNKLRDVLSEQSKTMYEIDSALWAANRAIQERENADGCVGCAYCDVEEWEMPCAKCKQNCKDYWRAKND